MTLAEFTKQPRGPYAFDFWLANRPIPSPMGNFTVELQMDIGEKAPPNDAMIRKANELVKLFKHQVATIHQMVFDHYKAAAEQGGWLGSCGVPAGLDRMRILVFRYAA